MDWYLTFYENWQAALEAQAEPEPEQPAPTEDKWADIPF